MNVKELYTGNLLDEAFLRLQSMRVKEEGNQRIITKLGNPEVIKDSVLMDFLAFNYICAVDIDNDGNTIMAEVGGVVPRNKSNGKMVLAFSNPGMEKAGYGLIEVRRARETNDPSIISELEEVLELPLETRGNVTIVQSTSNIAHYDFTTRVALQDPLDLLITNNYLLLRAEGFTFLSNKHRNNEQYVFSVPYNNQLFEALRGTDLEDFDNRQNLVKDLKDILIPKQFIAGFHMSYEANSVVVSAIIPEGDAQIDLSEMGLTTVPSMIHDIGISSAYGDIEGILQRIV